MKAPTFKRDPLLPLFEVSNQSHTLWHDGISTRHYFLFDTTHVREKTVQTTSWVQSLEQLVQHTGP